MISNRQIFYLALLLQQSGVFWLLPYFLVRENGTAGLIVVLPGAFAAGCIILTGRYWALRISDVEFVNALRQTHAISGTIVGGLFCLWYLLFAMLILYSFVDITQKQLLTETPRTILCIIAVLLAGWLGQGGLEGIARLNMLCIGALVFMIIVSVAGTADLFTLEIALPIQIKNVAQIEEAAMHSILCYSGLLSVFMLYPASKDRRLLHKFLLGAVGIGALLLIIWIAYALCVLGQYSLQDVLWIPVHLARMVQIGFLLDQTESLFIVSWMMIVMTIGSLFLWCASESVHQLVKKQKALYLHWGIVLLVFLGMLMMENTMGFLRMEQILAKAIVLLLPILLGMVVLLTPKRRDVL